MEMTTDEIVRSFREAKDRRKQVTILAELNDCSVEEIRSTLVAGGISWRELPRAPRAGKTPNAATTEDPSESRKSPPPSRDCTEGWRMHERRRGSDPIRARSIQTSARTRSGYAQKGIRRKTGFYIKPNAEGRNNTTGQEEIA